MVGRNACLNQPIDMFDPHYRASGKKAFEPAASRSLRTTIMLKFADQLNAHQSEK